MRRRVWPLAALVLIAVVAGCGNGSAGAGSSLATSGGKSGSSVHEKAVRFAECMRENGVSAFPDPDASGGLTIENVVNGTSVDTSSAEWKHAIGVCKDLEPPGFTGGKVTPEQRTARLEFAQCIRDNGVPDFPDPTANGPMVDTNRIPSANRPGGMDILNAAMQKCRSAASAAGITRGR